MFCHFFKIHVYGQENNISRTINLLRIFISANTIYTVRRYRGRAGVLETADADFSDILRPPWRIFAPRKLDPLTFRRAPDSFVNERLLLSRRSHGTAFPFTFPFTGRRIYNVNSFIGDYIIIRSSLTLLHRDVQVRKKLLLVAVFCRNIFVEIREIIYEMKNFPKNINKLNVNDSKLCPLKIFNVIFYKNFWIIYHL